MDYYLWLRLRGLRIAYVHSTMARFRWHAGSNSASGQLGAGVGALAADLLSATEVGLPLLETEDVALLPANVDHVSDV